jgi:hypothetical protein
VDLTEPRRALAGVASGTTLRFVSLLAAILGTATAAFDVVLRLVRGTGGAESIIYARCQDTIERVKTAEKTDLLAYEAAAEQARRDLGPCLETFDRAHAMGILVGMGVLLVVALILYLAAPWWIRRRLVPVTAAAFPRLHAEVTRLDGRTTFLLDPTATAPGGLAFGRCSVRLNVGLVPLATTDPATFRAIVRHELAHLRHRDVDLAYAVMALWYAFLAVALVPALAAVLYATVTLGLDWTALVIVVRALPLVLVVYLCRNAVLRSRERYADAHAAEFGEVEGLRRAVTAGGPVRWWVRRFGVHPEPRDRSRAIDDPAGLLRPGFGEMFGAGLTTMLAAAGIHNYAIRALPDTSTDTTRIVSWLIAPMAVGILVAAAWRTEVLTTIRGTRISLAGPAAGFGLGWLLGDQLLITTIPSSWGVFGNSAMAGQLNVGDARPVGGLSLSAGVLAALLLVGGMVCQAGVAAAGARAWLPLLRGRATWWGWAAAVAVTGVPFAVWFGIWWQIRSGPWLVGRLYSLGVDDPARVGVDVWRGPAIELITLFYPPLNLLRAHVLVVPLLALAWLYPLSARLFRRAHDGGVRLAVKVALMSAAAFAIILLGARAALRGIAPELAGAANFSGYFYFSAIAAATVLQAMTGWLVATRARASGLILGQFAALLVATASTTLFVLSQAVGGCVPAFRLSWGSCGFPNGWSYAWELLETIVVQGSLAALIGGAAALAIRRLPQPRSVTLRRATPIAAVCLLLVPAVTAGRAVYGTGAPITRAQAQSPDVPPIRSGPARPLTEEEARQVAAAATTGLPLIWRDTTPTQETDSGGENGESDPGPETRIEPPACRPFANAAYLAGEPVSSGTVKAGNGGKLSSSTLLASVRSYAEPVPASVLETAERDRVACPGYTSTTDGFQVHIVVRAGAAPALGDQSWRVESAMTSTVISPPTRPFTISGTTTTATVRAGYTLVTLTMVSVGEPRDETIFISALRRLVAALPA